MKTPKEFSDNLKNGIITQEMLELALYSVNKRAKNCRDKVREYRSNRYFRNNYNYIESYEEKKDHYYELKDTMLTVLSPVCIHKEKQFKRKRVYDYEKDYKKNEKEGNYVWANAYFDEEECRYVEFIDVPIYFDKYYIFYELGEHSFHTPIPYPIPDQYKDLEIKEIDSIVTYGHEFTDLISMQFVYKLIALIDSGEYEFVAAEK